MQATGLARLEGVEEGGLAGEDREAVADHRDGEGHEAREDRDDVHCARGRGGRGTRVDGGHGDIRESDFLSTCIGLFVLTEHVGVDHEVVPRLCCVQMQEKIRGKKEISAWANV